MRCQWSGDKCPFRSIQREDLLSFCPMRSSSSIRHTLVGIASLAGAASALSACGSAASPSTTTAPAASTISVPLQGAPLGTIRLSWSPSTKLVTAVVNMYDFTPGSSHAMHVHAGSCASPGSVLVHFPNLTASSGGDVQTTVTSTNPLPNGLPGGAGMVNIHLAPKGALGQPGTLGFTPISCADIPPGHAGSASLAMTPPPQAGQHPSGNATLSYDSAAKTLTVKVSASGLPPSTTHAEHLHLGSCQAQGAVKYDLKPLVAGASGTATATTTIKGATKPPASGWYLNVHMGSPSTILSGGNPALGFQPILCGNVKG